MLTWWQPGLIPRATLVLRGLWGQGELLPSGGQSSSWGWGALVFCGGCSASLLASCSSSPALTQWPFLPIVSVFSLFPPSPSPCGSLSSPLSCVSTDALVDPQVARAWPGACLVPPLLPRSTLISAQLFLPPSHRRTQQAEPAIWSRAMGREGAGYLFGPGSVLSGV